MPAAPAPPWRRSPERCAPAVSWPSTRTVPEVGGNWPDPMVKRLLLETHGTDPTADRDTVASDVVVLLQDLADKGIIEVKG